jgi:flagellar biosynthetic protein FliQ
VTQIQEQTLTFVPKIAAMTLAAIVLLPWIQYRLMEYAASIFQFGEVP